MRPIMIVAGWCRTAVRRGFLLTLMLASHRLRSISSLARLPCFPPKTGADANGRSAGAVTKKDIVRTIAEQIELPQLRTKDLVQRTFDALIDALVREGRIELRNFGVFQIKKREARMARNPRTGEKVPVQAKSVVTFKPGKEMEARVRELDRTGPPTPLPKGTTTERTAAATAVPEEKQATAKENENAPDGQTGTGEL